MPFLKAVYILYSLMQGQMNITNRGEFKVIECFVTVHLLADYINNITIYSSQ